jgi:hypothetical protein
MTRDRRLHGLRLKLNAYLQIEDYSHAKAVFEQILAVIQAEKVV